MEIPSINNRVRQIIDFQTSGNVKKFADSINIPQQTINRLFNIDTRTSKYPLVTSEILVSITEMYVNINSDWLLTGKGEMLKSTQYSSIVSEPLAEYAKPAKNEDLIIEELRKQNCQQRNDIEWYKKELDKKQEIIDVLLSGSVSVQKNAG